MMLKPIKAFLIAGARPNFMKIAPIFRASLRYPEVVCKIVHTGQHYDQEMSQVFFDDLDIPQPAFNLESGSGSHALQTAKIMIAFENICEQEKPDIVIVVGDVNSTLACSVVAKKMWITVAHVEAGLRSFDLTMPEEINRLVTDSITDYFYVTEESGLENLLREGKPRERIHCVGHVMIDNLIYQKYLLEKGDVDVKTFSSYSLKAENGVYAFLTLHRPSNVDSKKKFFEIADALNTIAEKRPIFFPVHPRTRKRANEFGVEFSDRIFLLPPLNFKESLYLWKDAEVVLTDSGGLQEETTALGIPCVTLRENTERPVTVEIGTNILAGTNKENIIKAYCESIEKAKTASVPPLWDGKTSERIWKVIKECFEL